MGAFNPLKGVYEPMPELVSRVVVHVRPALRDSLCVVLGSVRVPYRTCKSGLLLPA